MFDESDEVQELAYLKDTYLTEADSELLAVTTSGALVVKTCLFHPQGGGQPADRGWVDAVEVAVLRDHESGRVLLTPLPELEVLPSGWVEGATVATSIDRDLRLHHAALHTAGHLIEAAGRSLGWELAANSHFPGQARIEFTPGAGTLPTTPEDRERDAELLRRFVAEAIAAALPVTAHTDPAGYREVAIGTLHMAPCGGTHVRSLTCLRDVTLEVKVKKGRIRVSYAAEHAPM